MPKDVPEFCDFDCPHADFPPAETAGICRTMAAVSCRKLKEIVHKNSACEWRKRTAGTRRGKPRPSDRS